jgi:hypothetical protein
MTLRIQKSVEGARVLFTLTGRIQAELVPELVALLESEVPAHAVLFDLDQIKLVDREAVLFLAQSEERGIKLRNCSAYIRKWINQEKDQLKAEQKDQSDRNKKGK